MAQKENFREDFIEATPAAINWLESPDIQLWWRIATPGLPFKTSSSAFLPDFNVTLTWFYFDFVMFNFLFYFIYFLFFIDLCDLADYLGTYCVYNSIKPYAK